MEMFGKNYKLVIVIPTALLLLSLGILFSNYITTGEFFARSFELKGGTLVTLEISRPVDIQSLEATLSASFPGTMVRELSGFAGHSLLIQADEKTDVDALFSVLAGAGLDASKATVQTVGSSLGESFWYQTQLAIAIAFIFMGLIVFVVFRKILPSFYVILAALSDIVVTLGFMQIFGIELSLAGLAALLMILGYSIDTDIMLTSRLLRTDEGTVNERLKYALKTGLTMTGTTVAALAALVFSAISPVLSQIAAVLLIGLLVDIATTWMQNAVLLQWYMERAG